MWPFDWWTRFRNYITFRSNSVKNCRSILYSVVFKIVQHFETSVDIESFKDLERFGLHKSHEIGILPPHFRKIYRLQAFLGLLIHLALDYWCWLSFVFTGVFTQVAFSQFTPSFSQDWLSFSCRVSLTSVTFLLKFSYESHIKKISQSKTYFLTNTMLPWLTLLKTTITRLRCKLHSLYRKL